MPGRGAACLPAAAQLLGDEQVVIVAPPNGGDAVLLSAVDGHRMGRQPIESIAQRWLNWGPNTIATKNVGANIELRLYNVATGEVLWEDAFPQGTQGSRAGGDEFAILQKDGKFEIRSLVDGSVKISSNCTGERASTALAGGVDWARLAWASTGRAAPAASSKRSRTRYGRMGCFLDVMRDIVC